MKPVYNIISFGLLLILLEVSWAQSTEANGDTKLVKTLYETALLQVENLQLTVALDDSLVIFLKQDAQDFAKEGNWKEASEVLETILDLYENAENLLSFGDLKTKNDAPLSTNIDAESAAETGLATVQRFEIESGVDFSQQEFEITFLESDSILIEELQNPYISFSYFQPFSFGKQALSFTHRLRMDNQFINYNFFTNVERQSGSRVMRLELDESFYHPQTQGDYDYLDNRIRFFIGAPTASKDRWYVSARGRYKWFPTNISTERDILSLSGSMYYEHYFNAINSIYLNVTPRLYRESQGYSYFQNGLTSTYRLWKNFNRYLEIGGEAIYLTFRNDGSDASFDNRYISLTPKFKSEWLIASHLGVNARMEYEIRKHKTADAITPDFSDFSLQVVPKYYIDDFRSFGFGYFSASRKHKAEDAEDNVFAEQADFDEQGLVSQFEYLSLSGIMMNFEYRISWKNYPNSQSSLLDSYYSNRFVHSVSLFGWIPITGNWQFQLFANYDNDIDRSEQQNDTRNMLLNFGLIYKF